MLYRRSYFIVLLFLAHGLYGQQDSLRIGTNDSLGLQIDSVLTSEKEKGSLSPKKVALLSLAVPGAGHIYNKKYWKAPLVYTAMGATVFFIDRNNKTYKLFEKAYCEALVRESLRDSSENPCPNTPNFITNSNLDGSGNIYGFSRPNWQGILTSQDTKASSSLQTNRNDFDKLRQLSWIGLVAVHLVFNTAWSFVDAHLLDFDLDDDLSLKPSFEPIPFGSVPAIGLGISVSIGE